MVDEVSTPVAEDKQDLTDGQGLLFKRILKEGEGAEKPSGGCRVKVHYTGRLLDGTVFDSSRERDEPFEFTLGKGQVIKGWDEGIASMLKGELCVLSCSPEYAYGVNGSPPKIPPNSWLDFEVEMLSWQGEDLSAKKDNGVVRYAIVNGTGSDSPVDGVLVDIELVGKLHGVGDVEPFESRSVSFCLGEGSEYGICPGVEKALEKFTMGEKSRLVIQPKYAFKSAGNPELGVPSDAVIEYTITMKNFEKADVDSENYEYVMKQGKTFKDKGTEYFKAGKYALSCKMYKNATTQLSKSYLDGEENPDERNALLLSVHLNLALCYLKIDPVQPFKARDSAVKALELDPKNVKGLFRKGQALQGIGENNEAIEAYQQVLEIEPENKAATNQMTLCKLAIKKQNDKEKKLYANMFEKFAEKDRETEKLSAKNEPDVMCETLGEWGAGPPTEWNDADRDRAPTEFEKENPNILMLDKDGQFLNM